MLFLITFFFIRDLISFAKIHNLNIGFVSLDQEKAFDRVGHGFLFMCLESFGFGPSFIAYIRLLYTEKYSMLKINGTLTIPFRVNRGIRQGCGLSGILHAILIEPLLVALRNKLGGISTVFPSTSDLITARLSAYADDVTGIIRSQDVMDLGVDLEIYQKASSSRINWQKCASFLMGEWENEGPPKLPHNCSWSLEGFKVLGVFLGTDQYIQKNWDDIFEKVSGCFQRWKWILSQLSYRGRLLTTHY